MRRNLIIEIIAILFVILFVYAATNKLMDLHEFRVQLGQSPLLEGVTGFVSIAIPVSELAITGALIFSSTRMMGLYLSFAIMVSFSAYIFFITRFSDDIPCSCGGILEKMNWDQHLVFNLTFVVIAAAAVLLHPSNRKKFLLQ